VVVLPEWKEFKNDVILRNWSEDGMHVISFSDIKTWFGILNENNPFYQIMGVSLQFTEKHENNEDPVILTKWDSI
jgi:hypothetical protein